MKFEMDVEELVFKNVSFTGFNTPVPPHADVEIQQVVINTNADVEFIDCEFTDLIYPYLTIDMDNASD